MDFTKRQHRISLCWKLYEAFLFSTYGLCHTASKVGWFWATQWIVVTVRADFLMARRQFFPFVSAWSERRSRHLKQFLCLVIYVLRRYKNASQVK